MVVEMIGAERNLCVSEVRCLSLKHCYVSHKLILYTVCEPYEMPNDPCVSPSVDIINNLVEFKCLDNCTTSCLNAYLQCNHTSRQFEMIDFSPCVAGIPIK